jgi:N-acetylglutamate synthase-like GNAT family acetyltransferase
VIRACTQNDIHFIHAIVNDAANAYRGHIPADCMHEPYMTMDYLQRELDAGVEFCGYEDKGKLTGVMGIQQVQNVALIRHAYVCTACRNKGIGGRLISHLKTLTTKPMLVGTWAVADWAIRFYEKHGFRLVTKDEKDRLLGKYWSITERQTQTSVVLADALWIKMQV